MMIVHAWILAIATTGEPALEVPADAWRARKTIEAPVSPPAVTPAPKSQPAPGASPPRPRRPRAAPAEKTTVPATPAVSSAEVGSPEAAAPNAASPDTAPEIAAPAPATSQVATADATTPEAIPTLESATPVAPVDPEMKLEPATRARDTHSRRGRAQVIAGAALATTGLVGLGVMARGLYVQQFSARELARGGDYPDELLAPLRAQHDRGETMVAAGAITAAFGAALGVTLMITGWREAHADRTSTMARRMTVTPSLGGLVIRGRF